MNIFDTHTHDYFPDFDADQDAMMQADSHAGVQYKVQIGCDESTSALALQLAMRYDFCLASVGLHPCNVCESRESLAYAEKYQPKAKNRTELFQIFAEMIEQNPEKIVGVGETGFDFYHHDSEQERIQQTESFLEHCILAKKYDKTMIIHTRNASMETLDFLSKNNVHLPKRAIVHCFSEDANFANIITNGHGYMLGIGGVATYKKADSIRDAIKKTPLSFLVTETDAPYLAPQKMRGTRNQSKNIVEIIRCIAEVKNIDEHYCADALFENAIRTFEVC